MYNNIYDLITSETNTFQTTPITVSEGYEWQMSTHINTTVLYKNSKFLTGNSDDKPFKNIIRPILNLQYRAEGFDVKDIELYVDSSKKYFKSFLIKKYHDKWATENEIDTFIDDMVENYVDFGGALIKDTGDKKPEVVPWLRIAFCDQTDVLSGTIAEKHSYSPEQLQEMKSKGWENIDDAIVLAENERSINNQSKTKNQTPGKYIDVYEVHGMFPRYWLYDRDEEGNYSGSYYDEESPDAEYVRQVHICSFYSTKEGTKTGITFFKSREKDSPYKIVLRDKIYGRALGFGGAEELFEPQVWINKDVIRTSRMLEQASKIIYQTADVAYANRNKTSNLDNGEILIHEDGKPIQQINTFAPNIRLFENSVAQWEAHAQQMGAANDAILGQSPSAGTPFKLQELVTQESHSLHEYRKGKLATFLGNVYREWIIPQLAKEASDVEFLSELDLDELKYIGDALVSCEVDNAVKEKILNGQIIYSDQIEAFKTLVREEFKKGGNKKFIKILKDEFKNEPLDVKISISGKQKNLALVVDKLTNIFRTIIQAPQMLQSPEMADLFNQIIEASGLNPIDFSGFTAPQPLQPQAQPQTAPQQMNPQMVAPQAQPTY